MRKQFLSAVVAAALLPAAAAHAAPAPEEGAGAVGLETASTLDAMADWLLDRADGANRNGLMRKLPWVYGLTLDGCTESEPCLDVDVQQSTAACSSLEFLAHYFPARAAHEGRSMSDDEAGIVAEFADAVLDYRVDPTPEAVDLFDGAVASDPGARQPLYTTFGNAMCGQAMLSAHEATASAAYLDAAAGIGEFLLRMQDPRDYYAPYGVQPFVDADGAPTEPPGGFFDQVSSLNNTYSTMSLWNMTAVDFLSALDAEFPGRGYGEAAQRGRVFLEDGLTLGADWYTVKFDSPPATLRNRVFAQAANKANCQDNQWHRKGSCAVDDGSPVGGTLGTDMVEYALAAMYRHDQRHVGEEAAADGVVGHYLRYASLPGVHTATSVDPHDCVVDDAAGPVAPYYPPDNLGPTPTGDPQDYDPHLSFGGFFRSSGNQLVTSEAKYYDIVGFGILAEVRQAVVEDKFEHGAKRFLGHYDPTALLYRDMSPMALPSKDTNDVDRDGDTAEYLCIRTEGTLPIAHNGIGLLQTLGYVAPLVISDWSPEPMLLGQEAGVTLTATGGEAPYAWSVADGRLPTGVELAPDGSLVGAPLVPGTWDVTLAVTDARGRTATRAVALTVGGCDRTLTGVLPGRLEVSTGITCLLDATQQGTLHVASGAHVVLAGSEVLGAVVAEPGAVVTSCESWVAGNDGRVDVLEPGCLPTR